MSKSFCNCGQYCLKSLCLTSDSGRSVRQCWCAECRERRQEVKANRYLIGEPSSMTFAVKPGWLINVD